MKNDSEESGVTPTPTLAGVTRLTDQTAERQQRQQLTTPSMIQIERIERHLLPW